MPVPRLMRTPKLLLAAGISFCVPLGRAPAQCSPPAQRLIADRKFEEARAETQALLKANPNNDAALECMGRAYMNENKSGPAVDWFEKAVKANDNSAQHHLWL